MPMAKKTNMKIAIKFCIALLHLLSGHNALNLTATTVLVSVGCYHFYVLRRANGQLVCYSVTVYFWISTPFIDIMSELAFVVL